MWATSWKINSATSAKYHLIANNTKDRSHELYTRYRISATKTRCRTIATITTLAVLLVVLITSLHAGVRRKVEVKEEPKVIKPPPWCVADGNSTLDHTFSHGGLVHSEHGNVNGTGLNPDGSEKLAYVTLLSGTLKQSEDLENDNYFQAVRILVWQLVHNPSTKTKGIDVIVMVTPTVSESRRKRLAKDGAIVYPVEFLRAGCEWVNAGDERWSDLMTKLRVWEMTQYSRIMLLDGDTVLFHPLDGVFDDPGAQVQRTITKKEMQKNLQSKLNHTVHHEPLDGEGVLPEKYLLAGLTEIWDSTHSFPPTHGTGLKQLGYFNAGFFITAPSIDAFNYYTSILDIPHSFNPEYAEQNLLNHIHHWDGPMPWKELAYTWNIRCPNDNDIEQGLISAHEKWWTQPYIYGNEKTKDWLRSRRWEMKGWYDAYDMAMEKQGHS